MNISFHNMLTVTWSRKGMYEYVHYSYTPKPFFSFFFSKKLPLPACFCLFIYLYNENLKTEQLPIGYGHFSVKPIRDAKIDLTFFLRGFLILPNIFFPVAISGLWPVSIISSTDWSRHHQPHAPQTSWQFVTILLHPLKFMGIAAFLMSRILIVAFGNNLTIKSRNIFIGPRWLGCTWNRVRFKSSGILGKLFNFSTP